MPDDAPLEAASDPTGSADDSFNEKEKEGSLRKCAATSALLTDNIVRIRPPLP